MSSIGDPEADRLTRRLQIARTLPRAMRGHPAHMTALCEVSQMLSERVGLPASIHGLFAQITERWDGKGSRNGLKGDAIPLALSIAFVARDVSIQKWVGGLDYPRRSTGSASPAGIGARSGCRGPGLACRA